jgi:hypothetical protein
MRGLFFFKWMLCLLLVGGVFKAWGDSPSILYLSWQHDPTSTMTVQWHTNLKDLRSTLYYQKVGEERWKEAKGKAAAFHYSKQLVHTVELIHLEPATDYTFRIGTFSTPYRFRTMPKQIDQRVRFVVGGDVYLYQNLLKKMNQQIAKLDPDFIVIGGDIAYANGQVRFFRKKGWAVGRWNTFLKQWKKQMVTSDGRLIPMLVVVGNHDVDLKRTTLQERGLLFSDLFALPEPAKAYRAVDFGSYLSLFLLDTGHLQPIEGEQSKWLEGAFENRQKTPYKMAIYHLAAYPSVYPYMGEGPLKIRQNWVPLFEKNKLQLAFENHNHAYKRTFAIKEGKVDEKGVVYLGDGAWGVSPRKPLSAKKTWYLARSAQKNCFWSVTLFSKECAVESLDIKGRTIEKFTLKIPSS